MSIDRNDPRLTAYALAELSDALTFHEALYSLQDIERSPGGRHASSAHLNSTGPGHDELQGIIGTGNAATANDRHRHFLCYLVYHVEGYGLDRRT